MVSERKAYVGVSSYGVHDELLSFHVLPTGLNKVLPLCWFFAVLRLFFSPTFSVHKVTTDEAGSLSGLHVCLQGCGEVYCSAECRAEHLKRCHHLLCVGPVSKEEAETHPLVAFRVRPILLSF